MRAVMVQRILSFILCLSIGAPAFASSDVRLVSLNPGLTELVLALELGDNSSASAIIAK